MENTKLDSSRIEKIGYDLLVANTVSSHVFGGSRNMSLNYEEQVYVNAPLPIYDKTALGETMIRIEIYAKKIAGFKNAAKLTEIRDKVMALLPHVVENEYLFEYVSELPGDDNAGYNYIFLNVNVLIT